MQPVRFGAAPYAVEGSQNRLEWKELGPRRFERLSTRDSKMIGRRRIEVSEDGKTLTEANDTFDAVGAAVTGTLVYRRTSAEANGLIGVWTPESRSATTPFTVTVEAAGKTLRVIENQGLTAAVSYVLSFDGSPAAVTGPSVISGPTVSSQRVSDREIQQSTARLGVPTGVATWTVSGRWKNPDDSQHPIRAKRQHRAVHHRLPAPLVPWNRDDLHKSRSAVPVMARREERVYWA